MDFESRHIEVELENEEFQVDTDVTLSKQFVKNGDYYAAASFICNLEDTEGFDANLILDRKNLLSAVIAEDVQGVITVSPYFTVEVEKDIGRVGINVLVRGALLRKDVDYGGRLIAFIDETEVLVKSNRNDLKINRGLLDNAECFEQQPIKLDKQFVHKILQDIGENTAGLIRKQEEEYEISDQLRQRLLEMAKAYKALFSKVGIAGKGVRSLQQIGEAEEKCNRCRLVMRQHKYKDYSAGDKRNLSTYKLCFPCSGKKRLKRSFHGAQMGVFD